MSSESGGSPPGSNNLRTTMVFVYGTLMRGQSRHAILERHGIEDIEAATIPGRLVDLGPYPGLLPGEGVVRGELVRAGRIETLLAALDEIEGREYRREIGVVTLEGGGTERAWVYRLVDPEPGAPVIESGDWRRRESP